MNMTKIAHSFCHPYIGIMNRDHQELIKSLNLHDTQPRRLILDTLMMSKKPITHREIYERIKKKKAAVNLITVYRTLKTFEKLGIIHKHPSSGGFTLCSMPNIEGHHGFLSCRSCGRVEEFSDKKLCHEENRIAKAAGFRASHHISEIIGQCSRCCS